MLSLFFSFSYIPATFFLSLSFSSQTFVPDETDSGSRRGAAESSWLETVELTHTTLRHSATGVGGGGGGLVRGMGSRGEVLQNPLYCEEDDEDEEGEGEDVEMVAMTSGPALLPPSPTHSSDL